MRMAEKILRERTEQLVAAWKTGEHIEFPKKTFVLGKAVARRGKDLNAVLDGKRVLHLRQ